MHEAYLTSAVHGPGNLVGEDRDAQDAGRTDLVQAALGDRRRLEARCWQGCQLDHREECGEADGAHGRRQGAEAREL